MLRNIKGFDGELGVELKRWLFVSSLRGWRWVGLKKIVFIGCIILSSFFFVMLV